jgi:hypothetical protein
MLNFLQFILEEFLNEERTVRPANEEHVLVHAWNHLVGKGKIKHGEDNSKTISKELNKAETDKDHPLHFSNAKNVSGMIRNTDAKPKEINNSYHRALKHAGSTINTWAQHPLMKKSIEEKHIARVVGSEKGDVSDTWHRHGADKGATRTSKADVIIKSPKAKEGEKGINLSLKQAGGSMLLGAAVNENRALHDHAAQQMIKTDFAHKSQKEKDSIHSEVMAHADDIGKIQKQLKVSKTPDDQKVLRINGNKKIQKFHAKYPTLNYHLRKEAATGMGKFDGSGHSAHFFATTATEKGGATINHHTDKDMENIYRAPLLPRLVAATAGRISKKTGKPAPTRDARVVYDNRKTKSDK